MKITVDRNVNQDGSLVFTITAKEPNEIAFTENDKKIMDVLTNCKRDLAETEDDPRLIKEHLLEALHGIRDMMFQSVIKSLRTAIRGQLHAKIEPICQEIYNWMYDNQTDVLKSWLQEFDPQRVKYYFDNDRTVESDYDGE